MFGRKKCLFYKSDRKAMNTEIEVMYYKLYNSVLLCKVKEAKLYLEMLRNEYENNPEVFDVLKKNERWQHLVQLGKEIDEGLIINKIEIPPDEKIVAIGDEKRTRYEKELVDEICKNQNIMRGVLKASNNFYLLNREHSTLFGKVDLVGEDGKTRYVIEVKKGIAKHDVVSQIDKYMIDFKLKLILKIYNKVVGVVIANGFTDYVLKELQKMNVVLIKYTYNDNILKMRKLRSKSEI